MGINLSARERLLLSELIQRNQVFELKDHCFSAQTKFILDTHKFKAALTNRQAGKSFAAGYYLFYEALLHPGSNVLYCSKTKGSAKRIIWKDVLKVIDKRLGLGSRFLEQEGSVKLKNGSVIYLSGVDASAGEIEKLRGMKVRLVILDEAAFFFQDLKALVMNVFLGLVKTENGTICLMSTPGILTKIKDANGDVVEHYFYSITKHSGQREPGWSVHEWKNSDNPSVAENDRKQRERLIEANPRIIDTPSWKREFEGQWVVDHNEAVFHFDASNHVVPKLPRQEYVWGMGLDWGWSPDPTAMVVGAMGQEDGLFYVVDCVLGTKMGDDVKADEIDKLRKRYPGISQYWSDHKPDTIQAIKERLFINIKNADKTDKHGFIKQLDSDMQMGFIRVVVNGDNNPEPKPGDKLKRGTKHILDEWSNLIWDKRKANEYHDSCDDHLSDALLYLWRMMYRPKRRGTKDEIPRDVGFSEEKIIRQLEDNIKAQDMMGDFDRFLMGY